MLDGPSVPRLTASAFRFRTPLVWNWCSSSVCHPRDSCLFFYLVLPSFLLARPFWRLAEAMSLVHDRLMVFLIETRYVYRLLLYPVCLAETRQNENEIEREKDRETGCGRGKHVPILGRMFSLHFFGSRVEPLLFERQRRRRRRFGHKSNAPIVPDESPHYSLKLRREISFLSDGAVDDDNETKTR